MTDLEKRYREIIEKAEYDLRNYLLAHKLRGTLAADQAPERVAMGDKIELSDIHALLKRALEMLPES